MSPGARTGRLLLLVALLAALAAVAVLTPAPARGRERVALHHELHRIQMTEALVRSGAMVVRPRPEVLAEVPPDGFGILALQPGPDPAPSAELPSTALGAEIAREHSERELVSIAVDPRDLDDPERGIRTHPFETGPAWQRGACVTFFEGGEAVAASTAGLSIHGGRSRAQDRKSLRLLFSPEFGPTITPAAILPGARGDNLVLHNDRREQSFVNPIGYEFLERCGCDVPRTRGVRVVINGRLQPGIFFATEHVNEPHLCARLGVDRVQFHREHDLRASKSYEHQVRRLRSEALEGEGDRSWLRLDTDAAERWLAGILVLAPYDCVQGIAYRTERERRWRWICWDVDWGLGPWAEPPQRTQLDQNNIVELLLAPYQDLRLAWFSDVMRRPGPARYRMLARVRAVTEHGDWNTWWKATLDRYRATARRLLGADRKHAPELRDLDAIATWIAQRPAALRSELRAAFDLGPARRVTVRVPTGCSVVIEGYRYERDWSGHAFDGEAIELRAGPGAGLSREGVDLGATVVHRVAGDVAIELRPR